MTCRSEDLLHGWILHDPLLPNIAQTESIEGRTKKSKRNEANVCWNHTRLVESALEYVCIIGER